MECGLHIRTLSASDARATDQAASLSLACERGRFLKLRPSLTAKLDSPSGTGQARACRGAGSQTGSRRRPKSHRVPNLNRTGFVAEKSTSAATGVKELLLTRRVCVSASLQSVSVPVESSPDTPIHTEEVAAVNTQARPGRPRHECDGNESSAHENETRKAHTETRCLYSG